MSKGRWMFVVMILGHSWIMDFNLSWSDCLSLMDAHSGITRGCEVQD